MADFTAEDFATARFAAHPDGRVAARHGGIHTPWYTGQAWLSDERMTSDGWVPVTSRGGADIRAWQKRERLKRHIEDVEATLSRRNDENDRLRSAVREAEAERDELRARASAIGAITLDALRAAWEGAEVVTEDDPVREGDLIIERYVEASGGKAWGVFEATQAWAGAYHGTVIRILHRAPERPEGAERLGALIEEWSGLAWSEEPTPLADWLAERGVRVTEGGEK